MYIYRHFRITLISLLLLLTGLALAAPLHVWVHTDNRYDDEITWLQSLEISSPVRFDIFRTLDSNELKRLSGPNPTPEWQAAYAAAMLSMSQQWLLTRTDAALVMGKGPYPGTEEALRQFVKQGGTLIWTAPPRADFADLLPVENTANGQVVSGNLPWTNPFQGRLPLSIVMPLHGLQPLFAGVPLNYLPPFAPPEFTLKLAPGDLPLISLGGKPAVIYAKRGKGSVLFAPILQQDSRDPDNGGLRISSGVEGEIQMLLAWSLTWNRLFSLLQGNNKPPAVAVFPPVENLQAGMHIYSGNAMRVGQPGTVVIIRQGYAGPIHLSLHGFWGNTIASTTLTKETTWMLTPPADLPSGGCSIEARAGSQRGALLGVAVIMMILSEDEKQPERNLRPSTQTYSYLAGADSEEFINLLIDLSGIFIYANGDATQLSAQLATRPDGRQAIARRLGLMDWRAMAPALTMALQHGATFILGPEELGVDGKTGVLLQPWGEQGQAAVVQGLLKQRGARLLRHPSTPDILILTVGKGRLVLFRRGPDSTDGTPAAVARWHMAFFKHLHELGLTGGKPDLRRCKPAGKVDLRKWLIAP